MRHLAFPALMSAMLSAAADERPTCPVEGEAIQWIADYCMYLNETDDLIAASACIEKEGAIRFRSSCSQKQHFKAALCELVIKDGHRTDSVDSCVADADFVGKTVRENRADKD